MYRREKSDIDRVKLVFVSIFVFMLAFPYSVWGYLCFFPDIFSVLVAYWIASDSTKRYGVILVCGIIAILRTVFGGEFIFSSAILVTGLIASMFPHLFRSEFASVLKVSAGLSLVWVLLNFPFHSIGHDEWMVGRSLLCAFVKVLVTIALSVVMFPFVRADRSDRFVFWLE